MTAVAVAMLGIAVNAANCNWGTDWVYAVDQNHPSYAGDSEGGYPFTGKYWVISYADAADVSVDASGNVSGVTTYFSDGGASGVALNGASGIMGSIKDLSEANNNTQVGLVLFYDGADGKYWGMATGAITGIQDPNPAEGISGSDAKAIAFDNDGMGMTVAATKIEAVPEPTSGLLLLLGVAGLALRRRRA